MAEAERIEEQIFYRSEKAITFENFLTKCQKMYNIYQDHGEEMTEDAKLRFLFKKIDYPGLSKNIEAMKTKIATETPRTVTYTTVANHLSTAVSELPNYLARNRTVSVVGQARGGVGENVRRPSPHHGIFSQDGSIHTGPPKLEH